MSVVHPEDADIRAVYAEYLAGWNAHSAARQAATLADDADVVGFDGTQHHGRLQFAADLRRIFADHAPPPYAGTVRSVRAMGEEAAVLVAIAGMPAADGTLHPDLLAVHTVVLVKDGRRWKIGVFAATPASGTSPPDAVAALRAEFGG
ncbi:conserved hypothetical protein [Klenkia soli]|uniref:DUF4440 domain-containing protein n=1 Tax=Klenkia soli TaxID=1052260 RepID=A0A1H0S247_9ACTN|nr:conserved hypothetical protein [Klenkia soli]